MKRILYIILFCLNFSAIYAVETKIIYTIQNEIITNVDIKNEFKYLLALNPKLESLDKEKIFKISKDSIIREKIKKIELTKNNSSFEIDKRYTDNLLKNIYTSLDFKSIEEFNVYLEPYNQNVNDIIKKLTIDALWNELIIKKYNSKIEINEDELKKKVLNKSKSETTQYNLSEIIYEVKDKKNIEKKYLEIKKNIKEIGFENSASIYSSSESSKIGGNIGWISQESFNPKIMQNISGLDINEITGPIIISNGIMILKINEIKKVLTKINFDKELKELIIYERNRKLNQYSKIYFNKVKKNIGFNE
jgi:peptidyl-prolyl cis-trans isomerase SurA